MTLPTTGILSMSDVNVEIRREIDNLINLNDTTVRALAKKPSSLISMSDLRGKTYLYQNMVTTYMQEARNYQFQWCLGGTGDVRYNNSPYQRYVSTSSHTFTFPTDKHNLIEDSDTCMLFFAVFGSSAGNSNITGTVSDGVNTIIPTVSIIHSSVDMEIKVYRINRNFKDIKTLAVTCGRTAGNSGSWTSAVLIPGTWRYYLNAYPSSGADIYADDSYIVYGAAIGGGDGPVAMWASPPTDTARTMVDAYWYNNGASWLLTNPTSQNKVFTWTGGTREYYNVVLWDMTKP